MKKEVLLLSIVYPPNMGGVETHLSDLTSALLKRDWIVNVLSYKPITTRICAKTLEKKKGLLIIRIPWVKGLFYKLLGNPLLEFIYLVPGLFLVLPFVLLLRTNINVIHAHGLVGASAGFFWAKVFSKRLVVSTHNEYSFPKKGLYSSFSRFVFNQAKLVMSLSKKGADELKRLGVKNATNFTYWIDLKTFKPAKGAKVKLDWKNKFIVLFVGRLIEVKGIKELLEASMLWDKNIYLAIAGWGPLELNVKDKVLETNNIMYLGRIDQKDLPLYYSAADLLIIPSTHEEGFGRVILESLACGTPVLGARRGAIPEAMDETVGAFIKTTPKFISEKVNHYYKNKKELEKLKNNTRKYALARYSEKNVDRIIGAYS